MCIAITSRRSICCLISWPILSCYANVTLNYACGEMTSSGAAACCTCNRRKGNDTGIIRALVWLILVTLSLVIRQINSFNSWQTFGDRVERGETPGRTGFRMCVGIGWGCSERPKHRTVRKARPRTRRSLPTKPNTRLKRGRMSAQGNMRFKRTGDVTLLTRCVVKGMPQTDTAAKIDCQYWFYSQQILVQKGTDMWTISF